MLYRDMFMIWQHGEPELEKFVNHLNTIHPTIKFTKECSKTSINFLDITVTLDSRDILMTNWSLLLEKYKTSRDLTDAKLIFCQLRNKKQSNYLVRASTKTPDHKQKHTDRNPCKRSKNCRYRYCPLLDTSGNITSKTNGRNFQSMKSMNCQSSNLIYAITCTTCGVQYVGQTKKNPLINSFSGTFFRYCPRQRHNVGPTFQSMPSRAPISK